MRAIESTAEDLGEQAKYGNRKIFKNKSQDHEEFGRGIPDPLTPIRVDAKGKTHKKIHLFDDD